MKAGIQKFLVYAGILLLFYGALQYIFPAPCKNVIAYSIGTLDKKFGLSHEKFLQSIQKAESAWEKASEKELFAYDPSASFAINLVYDDRQEKTDRARAITLTLEKTSKTREDVKNQYDSAFAQYTKAQKAYAVHVASYEADVRELNVDVQKSNSAGGASSEEYERLQARQKELQARRRALEEERINLNKLALQVNTFADAENKIVTTYNAGVEKLHDEFGDDREFGQGVYTGKSITIYEFTNTQDLQLVLEHELGHALGIGHLPNPKSVMYYLVHKANSALRGPTKDDIAALEAQCKKTSWEIFLERLRGAYSELVLRAK